MLPEVLKCARIAKDHTGKISKALSALLNYFGDPATLLDAYIEEEEEKERM